MESQPQNPEFRNNLENFHPCICYYRQLLKSIMNRSYSLNQACPKNSFELASIL